MIDFIKDADCTKETPVKLGVPDAPIYGNGSGRRMERVRHLSKHAACMAADSVEVHLIRLDACGLISDLLVAGSVHGNAGLQLRMMVHIILHSL